MALTPSAVRCPEGGSPRAKCCIQSHPGPARLNSPLSLFPRGWNRAMSLPSASRSLFLSWGWTQGCSGRLESHAQKLLLGVPQPQRNHQPPPRTALVQLSVAQPPHEGWTLVSPLVPKHRATATGVQEQTPCAAPGCSIPAKSCCIT